uniref:BTB domain-containing protein n=1 Tax=Steinernema glaseri TaxID=37863 RepID=A0A1I8ABY1_9BILA
MGSLKQVAHLEHSSDVGAERTWNVRYGGEAPDRAEATSCKSPLASLATRSVSIGCRVAGRGISDVSRKRPTVRTETLGEESRSNDSFFAFRSDVAPAPSVKCDVCEKDLKHLNDTRRHLHVNACLDRAEAEKKLQKDKEKHSKTIDCLFCHEPLQPGPFQIAHVKKCGKSRNIGGSELLKMVNFQHKVAEANKKMGTPHTRAKPPTLVIKKPKKIEGRPRNAQEEQNQLALALSMSQLEHDSLSDKPETTKRKRRRSPSCLTELEPRKCRCDTINIVQDRFLENFRIRKPNKNWRPLKEATTRRMRRTVKTAEDISQFHRKLKRLERLADDLERYANTNEGEVTLIADGEVSVNCHQFILAARSSILKDSCDNTISLRQYSPDVIRCYVKYLYGSAIECTSSADREAILSLADQYGPIGLRSLLVELEAEERYESPTSEAFQSEGDRNETTPDEACTVVAETGASELYPFDPIEKSYSVQVTSSNFEDHTENAQLHADTSMNPFRDLSISPLKLDLEAPLDMDLNPNDLGNVVDNDISSSQRTGDADLDEPTLDLRFDNDGIEELNRGPWNNRYNGEDAVLGSFAASTASKMFSTEPEITVIGEKNASADSFCDPPSTPPSSRRKFSRRLTSFQAREEEIHISSSQIAGDADLDSRFDKDGTEELNGRPWNNRYDGENAVLGSFTVSTVSKFYSTEPEVSIIGEKNASAGLLCDPPAAALDISSTPPSSRRKFGRRSTTDCNLLDSASLAISPLDLGETASSSRRELSPITGSRRSWSERQHLVSGAETVEDSFLNDGDDRALFGDVTKPNGLSSVLGTPLPADLEANPRIRDQIGQHAKVLKTKNITPKPDYLHMDDQELKAHLGRYGLRPLGKKKAVALLERIYDETHPVVSMSPVTSKSKIPLTNSLATASKHRDLNTIEEDQVLEDLDILNRSSEGPNLEETILMDSVEDDEEEEPEADQAKGSSNSKKVKEKLPRDTDSLQKLFVAWLRLEENSDLYLRILNLQPVPMEDISERVSKATTIIRRISKANLIEVLDRLHVTFILPSDGWKRKHERAANRAAKKKNK